MPKKRKPYASQGVGGVSVFTTVGSLPMGKARNANNKERLARAKRGRMNAIDYARTREAGLLRGEMGYNPSGTQGAKGTEARFMNPAVYKTKKSKGMM